MNKIRSLTRLVVFFAVAAVVFVPAPSMGQEGSDVERERFRAFPVSRSVPIAIGFYTLGPGEKWLLALTLPITTPGFFLIFNDADGEPLADPVRVKGNDTEPSSKGELLIFITPKIVVERTEKGLLLTDPYGNIFNLRNANELPEFGVVAIPNFVKFQTRSKTSGARATATITIQGAGGETRAISEVLPFYTGRTLRADVLGENPLD